MDWTKSKVPSVFDEVVPRKAATMAMEDLQHGKRRGEGDSKKSTKKSKLKGGSSSSKGKDRMSSLEAKQNVEGRFDTASGLGKDKSKAVLQTVGFTSQSAEIGPVLISSTDFEPPRNLEYMLHHKVASGSSSSAIGRGAALEDRLVFAGETESMDYVAWNFDTSAGLAEEEKAKRETRGYTGDYMVGVYDSRKGTVTLRPAPVFILGRSIKSLNNSSLNMSSTTRDWQQRVQARRGLGETFGNRKTKLKARNEDRMKVDTSNMLEVMNTMKEGIEETMHDMPTEEEMQEEADQARPIPTPNLSALTPHEAYPLHVLIPDEVFRLINVKYLQQQVESVDQLSRTLPVGGPGRSSWLKDRMWPHIQAAQLSNNKPKHKIEFDDDGSQVMSSSANGILRSSMGANKSESKVKLKMLCYIALLWSFVKVVGGSRDKGGDKEGLLKKLKLDQMHGGETILDDLFARFAEAQRGSSRGQVTSFTETKLYAYIFALALLHEDFSIDPAPLSRDLGMSPARTTEIFKSLGCSVGKRSVAQSDGSTKQERTLILKVPFELPKPRKGRQPKK